MTEDEFKEELEKLLSSVSPERRQRLEGLQWRIDQVRQKYKANPQMSAMMIFRMMLDSLDKLNNALAGKIESTTSKADVLDFKKDDEEII